MHLIPKPQKFTETSGLCDLTKIKNISVAPQFERTCERIVAIAEKGFGKKLAQGDKGELLKISFDRDLPKEGYKMSITPSVISISASDAVGALYAMQSLRILARFDILGHDMSIECCEIEDYPAFSWRGISFDEARYFFGVDNIKRMIALMSMHKLNVLHWHLTDDVGWRIEIKKYPLLTEIGSKREKSQIHGWNTSDSDETPHGGFYTQDEIKDIVDYANSFGVMIVPEIDMPAHFAAAFAAYSWLACRDIKTEVPWYFGGTYPNKIGLKDWNRSACIGNPKTFEFVHDVIDEIAQLFPAPYFHIGGDEAPMDEWKTCPKCQAVMKEKGLANEKQLQGYFINEVQKYCSSKGKRLIGWNEVLSGKNLDKSVIVQYWTAALDPNVSMHLSEGGDVILSKHQSFYFDMSYSQYPLRNTYKFRPRMLYTAAKDRAQILGVEGALWTEWIPTQRKLDFQMFPRVEALSEVAWNQNSKNWGDFRNRLDLFLPILDSLNVNYADSKIANIMNPIKRVKNTKKWYQHDQDFEFVANDELRKKNK